MAASSASVSLTARSVLPTSGESAKARGILAGVSPTTGCPSGVEHLISYMLDIHQAEHRRPISLHRAQVGVGSILATTLWHRAITGERFVPEPLRMLNPDVVQGHIREAYRHLDDTGALAGKCSS